MSTDHVESGVGVLFKCMSKQWTVVSRHRIPLAMEVVRHYADEVQMPVQYRARLLLSRTVKL